jgi:hypothetical protein
MRALTLAVLCAPLAYAAGNARTDLNLIDDFDRLIQHRFADPAPRTLGMSRIAAPNSFGAHFIPTFSAAADFAPSTEAESALVAELAKQKIQTGLYVFGGAIEYSWPEVLNSRALKGPAVVTPGTPRPAWYPGIAGTAVNRPKTSGALPDWFEIYSVALRAIRSFRDGGKGFETSAGSWTIAARPVFASEERCVACHNAMPRSGDLPALALNGPAGGVLYAFRRAK